MDQQSRGAGVSSDRDGSRSGRDLEEALLSVDGVYSVQITGSQARSVDALYVRATGGRNVERTIADVRAAAMAETGIDIVPSRIHVMGVPTGGTRKTKLSWAIVSSARPRQWTKNILVFGAPATGGVLFEPGVLSSAVGAFVAFCLVASGIYYINDVVDAKADLQHPTKGLRPIASGVISRRLAVALGSIFVAAGMAVGLWVGGAPLVGVLAGYVALCLAYTFVLRNIALLDIAAIAGGFLLRAVAGGVATDVPLSMWFLIVAGFGSLFLAAGKRRAEYVRLGDERANHRPSMNDYSEAYLRYIQYSSSTITISAYTLWAFEGAVGGSLWSGLSIIPFVLGILRYALLLEKGGGETPEEVVLTDPQLIVMGVTWVLLVTTGIYLY
jgi:decaprenyl-phosphate phosphoribosyltransferase